VNRKLYVLFGLAVTFMLALTLSAQPTILSSSTVSANISAPSLTSSGAIMQGTQVSGQAYASNWAGYIVATSLSDPQPDVNYVTGSWEVQSAPSHLWYNAYSCQWIGIGGALNGDQTLIQVGTESNGYWWTSQYYAWYEMLPTSTQSGNSSEVTITSMSVHPGDVIDAYITEYGTSSEWQIWIGDLTTGQYYMNEFHYEPSMLSAEWIEERPMIDGSLPTLENFGTSYYGPHYTGVDNPNLVGFSNGVEYTIGQAFAYESVYMTSNGASSGTLLASTSALTGTTYALDSFTVTWKAGS